MVFIKHSAAFKFKDGAGMRRRRCPSPFPRSRSSRARLAQQGISLKTAVNGCAAYPEPIRSTPSPAGPYGPCDQMARATPLSPMLPGGISKSPISSPCQRRLLPLLRGGRTGGHSNLGLELSGQPRLELPSTQAGKRRLPSHRKHRISPRGYLASASSSICSADRPPGLPRDPDLKPGEKQVG